MSKENKVKCIKCEGTGSILLDGTLGSRLREIRLSKGLTLKDVENKTGYCNSMLSQIENDKHDNYNMKTLKRLASFYKVKLASLLNGLDD